MQCEVCGSRATRKSKIEGVILRVCNNCVKLGEELAKVQIRPTRKFTPKIQELEETINSDFYKIIKKERQKRNLTQEQLAKKLNEKLSVIRRIEDGWEPPLRLIRKLEKFFNLNLIEASPQMSTKKIEKKKLTIGDIVEIK
jgi:putative transcription factor